MTQTAEPTTPTKRTRKTGKIAVYILSPDPNSAPNKLVRVFGSLAKTFEDAAEVKKYIGEEGVLAKIKDQENIPADKSVTFVVAREIDSFTADIVQPAPKTVIK